MVSCKLLVLFYSFSGHTYTLAREVASGAREVEGVEVSIKQVPESIPTDVFEKHPEISEKRKAFENIPVATLEDLTSSDGVAFGTPVHFGSFASQLKQFIDQLSPVYVEGNMLGKPAACFVSAGSIHGGEEAALLSLMIPLLNLGMLPVGVPYPISGTGPEFDAGSPYGAIFVSGHKGDKELSNDDKKVAQILGKRLAALTKIVKSGCEVSGECSLFLSGKG